jgi:hypothetical protein
MKGFAKIYQKVFANVSTLDQIFLPHSILVTLVTDCTSLNLSNFSYRLLRYGSIYLTCHALGDSVTQASIREHSGYFCPTGATRHIFYVRQYVRYAVLYVLYSR